MEQVCLITVEVRYVFADEKQNSYPVGLIYGISYHIFASSIVTSNFDDNIQLIGLLGTDYKRASNFAEFRSPVWVSYEL